jgi:Tol biopolymer transport system component
MVTQIRLFQTMRSKPALSVLLISVILIGFSLYSQPPHATASPQSGQADSNEYLPLLINGHPRPNKLAFTTCLPSSQGCAWDIFVVNPDGSGLTNLTNTPELNEISPAWSPDGSKIVFLADTTFNGDKNIFVINADGSNRQQYTNNVQAIGTVSWSPNGAKIAFSSLHEGDAEIYMMPSNGAYYTRMTDNEAYDSNPLWSPSGEYLLYTYNLDASNYEIFTMKYDGADITNVTVNAGDDVAASWTPDNRITFTSNRDGNQEIYVMNVTGTGVINLTKNLADDSMSSWSHDGRKVVFVSGRSGRYQLYTMDANGNDQKQLAEITTRNDQFLFNPIWSPDDTLIAFNFQYELYGADIYVILHNGTGLLNLSFETATNDGDQVWRP